MASPVALHRPYSNDNDHNGDAYDHASNEEKLVIDDDDDVPEAKRAKIEEPENHDNENIEIKDEGLAAQDLSRPRSAEDAN